jgi:hypothetical protein
MSSDEEYKALEGDWKGFEFRLISKEDRPLVMEHIRRVFCRDEPLICTTGSTGSSAELANDICTFFSYKLEQDDGLSFAAIHKETQKVGRIFYDSH